MQEMNLGIPPHHVLAHIRMWIKSTMTQKILASITSLWSTFLQQCVQSLEESLLLQSLQRSSLGNKLFLSP